ASASPGRCCASGSGCRCSLCSPPKQKPRKGLKGPKGLKGHQGPPPVRGVRPCSSVSVRVGPCSPAAPPRPKILRSLVQESTPFFRLLMGMKNGTFTHAPILPPAAAFAAGSLLSLHLPWISLPLWGALALLALTLRRRAGICLAFLAFGVIAADVRLGLPADPLAGFDLGRPIEGTVRISGHWTPEAGEDAGWAAPADLVRLRQDGRVAQPSLDLTVRLPGTEEPPAYGSRLRIKGYLTRSSGFANRAAVPPGPWRLRAKSRALTEIEAPPDRLASLSGALRRRVDRAFREAGPESA